jgi:hypothetical protein
LSYNYQQPPQQLNPYGQPAPSQYGSPMPGQVSGGMVGQPAEIKWGGLQKGGNKVPVIAFIGRLADIVEDPTGQFGLRLVEKFDQVQILESPVPWPWATIDIPIKYSDREDSAWGRHVSSAKSLGLAMQAMSLAQAKADLVGKIYEMRQINESYGDDPKNPGQTIHGDVWRYVRIVNMMGAAQMPQPVPAQAPPQYVIPPQVQPPPVAQPQPQPLTAPTQKVEFNTTLLPTDTAPVRAKKLLHGKALNEWLGIALLDPVIKADSGFVNSIFDTSFITGLKAQNQVTLGPDSKFTVLA